MSFSDFGPHDLDVNSRDTGIIGKHVGALDRTLHDVLSTVLAEAMARDVIRGVYEPRMERVSVVGVLTSSGVKTGRSDRFPLDVGSTDIPFLSLDPQLLQYIYRNAVSNACKYGAKGGVVRTWVRYDLERKELKLLVINSPGEHHDKILSMGSDARLHVFSQGSRLDVHRHSDDRHVSSGDGAWIVQLCAQAVGGFCDISFEVDRTVFTFLCKAEPLLVPQWKSTTDFEVPPDTWGVAIDDSMIQRKLMGRILQHVGIPSSHQVVIGASSSDVYSLGDLLNRLLEENPVCKILILIDENLDYASEDDKVVISGSLTMMDLLSKLPKQKEARIFCLVRSANDSVEDVGLYTSRTHGFIPKGPMQRERVLEILAPLWADRFLVQPEENLSAEESHDNTFDVELVTGEELRQSIRAVDALVAQFSSQSSDEPEAAVTTWASVWSVLHELKGDVLVISQESETKRNLIKLINSCRGPEAPDLARIWPEIRRLSMKLADSLA
jgi:hypothetical protein